MTTVTFQTEGSRIVGFEVKGHSGYAPEGEDIVCAAVTSAVRLTECTINEIPKDPDPAAAAAAAGAAGMGGMM